VCEHKNFGNLQTYAVLQQSQGKIEASALSGSWMSYVPNEKNVTDCDGYRKGQP